MVLYSIAILIGASASRNANTNLVAGIINSVSAIIPFIVAIPLISKDTFQNHKFGISMAILAGITIALFSMALTKGYSINKVGVVAPVVFGGAIFLSTLLSIIFLKEKISLIEGIGLAVLAIGFSLIIYARAVAK